MTYCDCLMRTSSTQYLVSWQILIIGMSWNCTPSNKLHTSYYHRFIPLTLCSPSQSTSFISGSTEYRGGSAKFHLSLPSFGRQDGKWVQYIGFELVMQWCFCFVVIIHLKTPVLFDVHRCYIPSHSHLVSEWFAQWGHQCYVVGPVQMDADEFGDP